MLMFLLLDISCCLSPNPQEKEPISLKYYGLYPQKNEKKKNILNLSSLEFARQC